jgi:hypothetical protein
MAVLTGKSGTITFVQGYDQHCHSWTIEIAQDAFEDTALGDSWRTRVVGVLDWTGSYDCYLDDVCFSTAGTIAIAEAAAEAIFTYAAGAGTITGNIIITGITVNTNTEGANTATFTFSGTAAPTFA